MPIGLHSFVDKKKVIKQQVIKAKVMKVKPTDTVMKTVKRCIDDFKKKLEGTGLWDLKPRAIARLESRCYWAHMQLAVEHHTIVELDALVGGKDYRCKLMRDTDFLLDSDWQQPVEVEEIEGPHPHQEVPDANHGRDMFAEVYAYMHGGGNPDQQEPDIRGAAPNEAPEGPEAAEDDTASEISSPEDAA